MLDKNSPSEHPDVRYEKSDARFGAVIASGVLLAIFVLIAVASTDWLFDHLKDGEKRKYQPLPALAAKERAHFPDGLDKIPEPRLQVSEPLDLATLRQLEDSLLKNYGWVDRDQGVVRIPIDEAMRLLVERSAREGKK
jgi:hypothetical protein